MSEMASVSAQADEKNITSEVAAPSEAALSSDQQKKADKQEVIDVEEEAEDDCMVVKIDLSKCHFSYGKHINNLEVVIDDSDDEEGIKNTPGEKNFEKVSSCQSDANDKQHHSIAVDSAQEDIDVPTDAVVKVETNSDLNSELPQPSNSDLNSDSPELSNDSVGNERLSQTSNEQTSSLNENSVAITPASVQRKQAACKFCSEKFPTRSDLVYHIMLSHSQEKNQQDKHSEPDKHSALKAALMKPILPNLKVADNNQEKLDGLLNSINPLFNALDKDSQKLTIVNPPTYYQSIASSLPTTQCGTVSLPTNEWTTVSFPTNHNSTVSWSTNQNVAAFSPNQSAGLSAHTNINTFSIGWPMTSQFNLPPTQSVTISQPDCQQRVTAILQPNQNFIAIPPSSLNSTVSGPDYHNAIIIPTGYHIVTKPGEKEPVRSLIHNSEIVASTAISRSHTASCNTIPIATLVNSPANNTQKKRTKYQNKNTTNNSLTNLNIFGNNNNDSGTPVIVSVTTITDPNTPFSAPATVSNDSMMPINTPVSLIKDSLKESVIPFNTSQDSLTPITPSATATSDSEATVTPTNNTLTTVSQSSTSIAHSVTSVTAADSETSDKVNICQTYCVCCECCRKWFSNYSCLREHLKIEVNCKKFHDELFKPKRIEPPSNTQQKAASSKKPNISCISCKRKFATEPMLNIHLEQNIQCKNAKKSAGKSDKKKSAQKNSAVSPKENSSTTASMLKSSTENGPSPVATSDLSSKSQSISNKGKASQDKVKLEAVADTQQMSQQSLKDNNQSEHQLKSQGSQYPNEHTSSKTSPQKMVDKSGSLDDDILITHSRIAQTSKPPLVDHSAANSALDTSIVPVRTIEANSQLVKERVEPPPQRTRKESSASPAICINDSDTSSMEESTEESASSSDEDALVEYKCKHCSGSFSRRSDLKKHLKSHKKGSVSSITSKRKIHCKVCKKKFKDHTDLQAHLLQRRFCFLHVTTAFRDSCEQGAHICQMCKKSLPSALDLSKHCYKSLTCRLRYIDLVLQNIKARENNLSAAVALVNIPEPMKTTNAPSLLHEKVGNTHEVSGSTCNVSQDKLSLPNIGPVSASPLSPHTISLANTSLSANNSVIQDKVSPAASSSATMTPSDVSVSSNSSTNRLSNNLTIESQSQKACKCCNAVYTNFLKHILSSKNCLNYYEAHPRDRPDRIPFCFNCKRKFKLLDLFTKHKCVKVNFECSMCGLRYPLERYLKQHISHSHTSSATRVLPDATVLNDGSSRSYSAFSCLICEAQFATLKLLMDHSQQHTEEQPFVCSRCNTTFYHYNRFVSHQAYHIRMDKEAGVTNTDPLIKENLVASASPATPFVPVNGTVPNLSADGSEPKNLESVPNTINIYECYICPKIFYEFHTFKNHIASHSKVSYNSCKICYENFPSEEALKDHSKRHEISRTSRTHFKMSDENPPLQVKTESPVPVAAINCLYCHQILTSPIDKNEHLSQSLSCKSIMSCILEKQFFIHPSIGQDHLDSISFKPNQCKFCFESFPDVITHILQTPCLTLFEAGVLKYRSSFSLLNDNNTERLNAYTCEHCQKGFPKKLSLDYHRLSVHKIPTVKITPSSPTPAPVVSSGFPEEEHLFCFRCRKYFTTPDSVIEHNKFQHRLMSHKILVKMGDNKGRNVCKICNKLFGASQRKQFFTHMFRMHNEGTSRLLDFVDQSNSTSKKRVVTQYCCSLCDMVMSGKAKPSHLKKHVNTFLSQLHIKSTRPLLAFSIEKCPICKNVLHSRRSLKQHLLRHRAQDFIRPLLEDSKCKSLKLSACPECKRWFKSADSMKYHVRKAHQNKNENRSRSHTEESSVYKTSDSLNGLKTTDSKGRGQELIATEDTFMFPCKLCNRKYETKSGLRTHLKRNHKMINMDDIARFSDQPLRSSGEKCKSPLTDVAFSESSNIDPNRAECRAGFSLRPTTSTSMNCHICQSTIIVQEYQSHLKSVHNWPLNKLYDCSYCNMKFPFQNLLPGHLEQCKYNCRCLICHKQALSVRGFQSHLSQKHDLSLGSYVSAKFSSSLIRVVNDGLKIVTAEDEGSKDDGSKVRVCLLCRLEFTQLSEYKEHLKIHLRKCWVELEDCNEILEAQYREECQGVRGFQVTEELAIVKCEEMNTEHDWFTENVNATDNDQNMPCLMIADDTTSETESDYNKTSVHLSGQLASPEAPVLHPEKRVLTMDNHDKLIKNLKEVKTEIHEHFPSVQITVQEEVDSNMISIEHVDLSVINKELVDSSVSKKKIESIINKEVVDSSTNKERADSNIRKELVDSNLINKEHADSSQYNQSDDSNLISKESDNSCQISKESDQPDDSNLISKESDQSSLLFSLQSKEAADKCLMHKKPVESSQVSAKTDCSNETSAVNHSNIFFESPVADANHQDDVALLSDDHPSPTADTEWMNKPIKKERKSSTEDTSTAKIHDSSSSALITTKNGVVIIDLENYDDFSGAADAYIDSTLQIITDNDAPTSVSHRRRSSGDENLEEMPAAKRAKLDGASNHVTNKHDEGSVSQYVLPLNHNEPDRNLFKVFQGDTSHKDICEHG